MAKKRPTPFTPEDVRRIKHISDPAVHPSGSHIAYVVRWADRKKDKNRWRSQIRVLDSSGRNNRVLTAKGIDSSSPLWSPDGKTLLFLSKRKGDEEPQVYLLPWAGGEGRRLTKAKGGVSLPLWSPDGKRVAYLAPVDPRPTPKKGSMPHAKDVEIVDSAWWRVNGGGSFLRGRYHLFVQSVRGGKPIQLTEGAWSVGSFSFLPDGRILYSATPHPEDDFSQVMESDLFEVSPDGGKSKRITKFNGTLDQVSAWSKDRLVALGSDLAKSWASPQSLWWVERKGGKTERIAPDWDRSITDSMNCDCRFPSRNHAPWISPDKKTTIVGVTAGSSVRLAKVGLEDSKVEMVTPSDCSVLGWHTTPDGSLRAEIRSSMNTFPELWFTTPEGSFKATRHNDTLMASKRILKPVNLSFKASDGKTVEAWLVLPRRRQRKPAPLILAIHGGPKTVYGHAMMMEFQMLAGAGYGVLFLNPRGSDGYGTDWAHAVFGAYGERDYQDLMEGVDHALAGGWNLDAHRLGVQGGSYGGFMTNWIVGHTNRFKAAVTQRGISDFSSFYGTSDIGFFFGPEQIGGTPWENPERYSEKSPLTHMVDVKAATLIIHSENDLRCPIGQADQLYAQLRIQGSTVQMARFPEETHELSRTGSPNRKMERLRLLLGWFRKHL